MDLARQFRAVNDELTAFTRALSDDDWSTWCEREGRSVGQVIEHIAAGHLIIGGIVEAIAFAQPLPVAARRTDETGARFNARQAVRFSGHTRAQGLRALRRNGGVVERFIEALTDEELSRTIETPDGRLSTGQAIHLGLLGHMRGHFDAVRETIEPRATPGAGGRRPAAEVR